MLHESTNYAVCKAFVDPNFRFRTALAGNLIYCDGHLFSYGYIVGRKKNAGLQLVDLSEWEIVENLKKKISVHLDMVIMLIVANQVKYSLIKYSELRSF